MITLFIDASVLFSASLSPTGASREIIRESIRGNAGLVLSDYILKEVERNLNNRYPDALLILREILKATAPKIVNPTKRQILAATKYTVLKDAPVVAAARRAKVDYLATLDRRHLVDVPEVAKRAGLRIVLPEEALRAIRAQARR
jgi:predicted nucleic acid-binding protein